MTLREADIRPEGVFERYLQLSRDDADSFFADPGERELVPCPGCGDDAPVPAFGKHGFDYVECTLCRSLYVSPRPRADAIDRFYSDSPSSDFWAREFFPTVAEARRERIVRPRVERLLERCRALGIDLGGATAIDVGAGAGTFLEELRAAEPGLRCVGVEPGRLLADQARERGLEVVEASAGDARELAGEGAVVTSFEVIEHLHDPQQFVSELATLARPDGVVLVTGLGGDGFDVQTLWRDSTAVSPPHHLNFISVQGFEELFGRAGFAEVRVETPGDLDVELVRKAVESGRAPELPRFLSLLVSRRGPEVHEAFQRFLQQARLSSHTWIWARTA